MSRKWVEKFIGEDVVMLYKRVRLQEVSADQVFGLRYAMSERMLVLPVSSAEGDEEGEGMWRGEVRGLTLRELSHVRTAFYNLHFYEPRDDSNLERVRGYLEAFHHLCELEEWEEAGNILEIRMDTPTQDNLDVQLHIWGYYSELIEVCSRLLDKLNHRWNGICLTNLGNSYICLGQYQKAIDCFEQDLVITREIGDRLGEGQALGSLGNAYNSLGKYQLAIDYYQQHLAIAREIGDLQNGGEVLGNLGSIYGKLGEYQLAINYLQKALAIARAASDRQGEGQALGNLGNAYCSLGKYQLAIDYYQQHLAIAREISACSDEGTVLGNLGVTYSKLGKYQLAIDYLQQHLAIAREIGDRKGEGWTLINLGNAYQHCGKLQKGFAAKFQGQNILRELGLTVHAMPSTNWLKALFKFADRGWWQLALCSFLLLVAFPFFLVLGLGRIIWWWGRTQVRNTLGGLEAQV